MAKEDIINAHIEAFMAGKSPEYREKFLKKSIDNQYASIAGWRRRNREKQQLGRVSTAAVAEGSLLVALRKVRKQLENTESLTEKESERLRKEAQLFLETVERHAEIRKEKEIQSLENEAARIERRIATLRGETEA